VCQNLSQCQKFWQSYCKNKIVQFLGDTVYFAIVKNVSGLLRLYHNIPV